MSYLQSWVHANAWTIDNYGIPLIYPTKYVFLLVLAHRLHNDLTVQGHWAEYISHICVTSNIFLRYFELVEAIVHLDTSGGNQSRLCVGEKT